MDGTHLSQHPADRLIRDLIRTGCAASDAETEQVIERIATAPFDPSIVNVRVEYRGVTYLGRRLSAHEDALAYHLTQRVLGDRQWAEGTTVTDYLEDLRRAIGLAETRLAVYLRRGGHMAAAIAPTDAVLPPERRGTKPLPYLIVLYSADQSKIVSGYQFTGLETVSIPEEALWLK